LNEPKTLEDAEILMASIDASNFQRMTDEDT